ncbi:NAD-dependent epimerase/dehydratase family protein [Isosphaeraceae bacterium EP7]
MNALVTGAGGFLGLSITRQLVARGDSVRSLARNAYPVLEALGVDQIRGDLSDPAAVARAVGGVDVVFHVAARAGVWGPYVEFDRVNHVGTRHVVDACRASGVGRLVYTSSPSVVFGGHDLENADESTPYPDRYDAPYPATKALAERLVLAANGPNFATVALRPHLIWGPGDNHLVPRIIARGRAGKLRRIGHAPKLVDSTYVDNAADAHLLAADRLAPGSPPAGRAYFIAQGEPVPVWDLVDRILAAAGLPPVRKTVSPRTAYAAGAILEAGYRLFGMKAEPPMTRFLAGQLSHAHWFDLSAARRDLGYNPRISLDEGLSRLAASLA